MPVTNAEVRELAREIVREMGPGIAREAAWTVIRDHINACPVRTEIEIKGLRRIIALMALTLTAGGAGGLLSRLPRLPWW